MTVTAHPDLSPPVPERILSPLRQVAGMQRFVRLATGFLRAGALVLAIWLAAVLTLGLVPLPLAARVAMAVIAWGSILVGLAFWIVPATQRRSLAFAAGQVEAALPEVQERISSAVELAQEPDARYRGSPSLIAQLTRQAEAHAQAIDPQAVISGRSVVKWSLLCLPLVLAWLVVAMFWWPTVAQGMRQTIFPWETPAAAPPVQIIITPGDRAVPQGGSLTITAEIQDPQAADRRVDRAALIARYNGGQAVTTELDRLGPRTFQVQFENVQQSFAYGVSAAGAESATYQISVLKTPAAQSLDVHYIFPPYTGLKTRTDTNTDGTIEAVVGTQARLIVHASQPLVPRSKLLFAEGTPQQVLLPLQHLAGNDYAADLTLTQSGMYRLELANNATGHELTNGDKDIHRVVARPDTPPTITITSPQSLLRIRPDDAVPVKFSAGDDFGVASIVALVQVDDRPVETIVVPMTALDRSRFDGAWKLAVAEHLSASLVSALDARRITYQLKATDNCVPTAHSTLSAKQVLEIDRTVESIAARQAGEKTRDLAEAIRKAQDQLAATRKQIEELQKSGAQPPSARDKQAAQDAREQLAQTAQTLSDAARDARQTEHRDLADKVDDVVQHPIQDAAGNVAQSQLATDQPAERAKDLANANQQIAQAQEQLDKLSRELDKKQDERALADKLQTLAEKQRALAQDLQKADPTQRARLQNEQKDLQKELEKVIRDNPELQKPAAANAEPKMQGLADKVEALRSEGAKLEEEAQHRKDAQQLPQTLHDLAQQQDKLNKDVSDFANQQHAPLQKAGAQEPGAPQLDPITKNLETGKLQSAAQQEKAAGAAMTQAADRLDQAARKAAADAARDQANAAKTQEATAQAKKIDDQVQQLGQDIQAAKDQGQPPVRPGDAPNQKAQDIAQQVQRQADEMAQQNPAQKPATDEAKKSAEAAQQAAREGRSDEARQKLADASRQLGDAARSAAQQSATSTANQQAAQDAARQGRQLAERQQKLAEQTDKALQTSEDPANQQDPSALADRQQALGDKIDQARKDAERLDKETAQSAPQTSQRARDASQALRDAADQQRRSASATKEGKPGEANDAQNKSDSQLSRALQALRGQSSDNAQASNPQPSGQPNGQPSASGEAARAVQQAHDAQGAAAQGDVPAAGRAADQLAHAARSADQATRQANQGPPNPSPTNGSQTAQGDNTSTGSGTGNSGTGTAAQPNGTASSGTPGQPGQPGQPTASGTGTGVTIQQSPSIDSRPQPVKDVGISPGDWARLPPLMQQQLLNAAQQKGPPSYQEQIKNYYQRIARITAESETDPKR